MNSIMETSMPHAPVPHTISGSDINRRILIVDDNAAIHDDYRKILGVDSSAAGFREEEEDFFGKPEKSRRQAGFEMDFAFQGFEALEHVKAAIEVGRRYAVAFIDVRMPPGWDGLETTLRLWDADPDLQIVICTAYSDYSWNEMMDMIKTPERLLILKKPFDSIEVLQLANALTEKWSLIQAARQNLETLESTVRMRTRELESANLRLEAEIVERKAAGERIREQAMLIESAHDAIIVRDMDDTILFWNKGAESLYGWPAADATGRTMLEVLHQGEPGKELCEARRGLLDQGGWNGEMTQKARDGRTVKAECHWTLLRDDQGRPKSVLAINTDVTDKRELEAQFLRAQRMESIGVLAGGIAHDLNNMVAPILLACDLLKPSSEMEKGTVLLLRESAQRAADLVQQILSFARGAEVNQADVDLRHLITGMEKIARVTFQKDIEIKSATARGLWNFVGDPTQLHQVLMNLCVNARDAMPGGGVLTIEAGNLKLDVRAAVLRPNANPGRYVAVSVTDTGEGITDENKERIFDPFFTTKELGKGSGLGLSTSFGIVKSHGGFIEVESQPGKGSTFRVCLPAKPDAPSTAAPIAADKPALRRGQGEMILLVDDEEPIRLITRRTLEMFGYSVLVARDGLEALAVFTRHQPEISLVLTDMMMPNMDGLELIGTLKAIQPDVRIVAASGAKTEAQRAKAIASGVKHFLSKPYTAESMLTALDELLRPVD
jgi:two-component system cell cycle sensor histidine kinase/response regulator CckA